MALFSRRVYLMSALLVIAGTATWTRAEGENAEDGEATVESVEEEVYHSPTVDPKKVYLAEHFDDVNAFNKKWVRSESMKQDVEENIAKYDGKWEIKAPQKKILKDDLGLVLTTHAKHAAISALLDKPFEFKEKPLFVQYEVTMQEGQECGGAYIKLLSRGSNTKEDLLKFHDQTPYTIMFGPDKCGNDNKLHFIFRHRNPKTGLLEEKHSKKPSQRLEDIYKDKEPHLYTLKLFPDNTYEISIDNKVVNTGYLLSDFTPPVNPPEEIDDPNDKKPQDWDEREKIVDPTAVKPEDWDEDAPAQIVDVNAVQPDGWLDDEATMVPDPAAVKPDDWDDDMDGEWEPALVDNPKCADAPGCGPWEPPLVANPAYKGKWRAPTIDNPNYRGRWSPRRIRNPDFFYDSDPFKMTPIHAVGFELWSMSPALLFDNLLVTDDPRVLEHWTEQTYRLKREKIDRDADTVLERVSGFASSNPLVFAVCVLLVFLAVGALVYTCCAKRGDDVDYKKTDAFTEDDPREDEVEGEAVAEEEPREKPDTPAPAPADKPTKHQLERPEDEPDSTETTPVVDTEAAGDGQRKRKPRKE